MKEIMGTTRRLAQALILALGAALAVAGPAMAKGPFASHLHPAHAASPAFGVFAIVLVAAVILVALFIVRAGSRRSRSAAGRLTIRPGSDMAQQDPERPAA